MNKKSTGKKTLHNTNCCVYKCFSRKNKNRILHFHAFPKKDASMVNVPNAFGLLEKMDRRKAWAKALRMRKPVTHSMRVCSLHFQESDYLAKGAALLSMNRPKLKATAVPSRNLPEMQDMKKLDQDSILQRNLRFEKRSTLRDMNINPQLTTDASHPHDIEHIEIEHIKVEFIDETEKELSCEKGSTLRDRNINPQPIRDASHPLDIEHVEIEQIKVEFVDETDKELSFEKGSSLRDTNINPQPITDASHPLDIEHVEIKQIKVEFVDVAAIKQ